MNFDPNHNSQVVWVSIDDNYRENNVWPVTMLDKWSQNVTSDCRESAVPKTFPVTHSWQ